MSDSGIFIPWVYMLYAIHLAAFWVIYYTLVKPKNELKPQIEGKTIPFETEAWQWIPLYLCMVIGAIWLKPYYKFLSESSTLFVLLSMYLISKQKKTDFIIITERSIIIEGKEKQIIFERMLSIKFAEDHIEIWSKSFVQHYHEFTKHELKENWEFFKTELLIAVQDKEWITVSTTIQSQPAAAQPPRSPLSAEPETHTGK